MNATSEDDDLDPELDEAITNMLSFVNDVRYKLIALRAEIRRLKIQMADNEESQRSLGEARDDWRYRALMAEALATHITGGKR